MTAEDLARWDVSFIDGRVPGPEVLREITREVILPSGVGTGHGLGVALDLRGDRRVVRHDGEMSGFTSEPADAGMLERMKAILEGLRKGRIDRTLLTANANAYFTEQALRDFRAGLERLGTVKEIQPLRQSLRGGLTTRVYRAFLGKKKLRIVTRAARVPDGSIRPARAACSPSTAGTPWSTGSATGAATTRSKS